MNIIQRLTFWFLFFKKKKYFNSKKGGEDLKKLFKQAKDFTDSLQEERIISRKELQEPYTV